MDTITLFDPVDIVISFDTTGSMSPAIAEVRRVVKELLQSVFQKFPDLRISIVSHGDYCDGNKMYSQLDFTNDQLLLEHFVRNSPNTGGGDGDECYEYVLQKGLELNYRADAKKFFILIADANPHESSYRNQWSNNGLPLGVINIDWKTELKQYAERDIKIFAVNCLTSRIKPFYQKCADVTGGKAILLSQFAQVVEMLTLAIYSVHSQELAEKYAQPLLLNRGFRAIAETLLGKTAEIKSFEAKGVRSDGLIPVDPARFQYLHVDEFVQIRDFVNATGLRYKIGKGFYQLTKTEEVQEHKEVVLRDKITGDMFTGEVAREMIDLPYGNRGKVNPRLLSKVRGEYDVFVQSTSVNRKLFPGTFFLYEAE